MITLTLPIPPIALRPNGRTHWRGKHKVQQRAKADGLYATREIVSANPFADGPLCLRYIYYPPKRGQFMDDDNLIGAMKYYRDGIAQGLGINDVKFLTHPVQRGERDGHGRVVVEIWQEK